MTIRCRNSVASPAWGNAVFSSRTICSTAAGFDIASKSYDALTTTW
ncbi:MAG: hypothetical protein QM775_36665 [Pirellulales bacterium]